MKMISNSRARRLGVRKVWKKIDLGHSWSEELVYIAAWCMMQESPSRFLIREAAGIAQFEDPMDAAHYALCFDLAKFREDVKSHGWRVSSLNTTYSTSLMTRAQYLVDDLRINW